MRSNKKLLADVLLIGLIIVIALSALLFIKLNEKPGDYVVVRIDGKDVAKYSLKVDGTYSLNQGTNIMVIENGVAYLTHANCPDKICVNQGKISKGGQVITCLPNKLTITVVSDETEVDFMN